jgi:4-carboxymuconolactone decarboxylase
VGTARRPILARKVGVSDEEIARVKSGPEAEGWTELEAAVLHAADELHSDACITNDTWAVLAAHLDERQLIEVPMVFNLFNHPQLFQPGSDVDSFDFG